jgi:hypothetical protein
MLRLHSRRNLAAAIVAIVIVVLGSVLLFRIRAASGSASSAEMQVFPAFLMTLEVRDGGTTTEVHQLSYDAADSWQNTLMWVTPSVPRASLLTGSYQAVRGTQLIYHSPVTGADHVTEASPGIVPSFWLVPAEVHVRRGANEVRDVPATQRHIRATQDFPCPASGAAPIPGASAGATNSSQASPSATATAGAPSSTRADCAGKQTYRVVEDFYYDRATGIPLLHRTTSGGAAPAEKRVTSRQVGGREVPLVQRP